MRALTSQITDNLIWLFVQQLVQFNNRNIKLHIMGLGNRNPLLTDGFPAQRTSNAERDIFLPWTLKWPYIETCIESCTQYRTINCDLKFILLPQFKKDNRFNEHAHPFKLILPWINNCGACYFEKKIRILENQRKVLNKSLMHSLKKTVWEIYISMASYKIAVTPLITQCSYCSY